MLLYYITDRNLFSGTEAERRARLLDNVEEAARCGVDCIQLREKALNASELEKLASQVVARTRRHAGNTRLLINSRVDVAIAAGADGVHLRSGDDLSASEARNIFHAAGILSPTIAVSCHTLQDVYSAEGHGADLAVFGPVFGKLIADGEREELPGIGIEQLRAACHRAAAASSPMPVLALGGITLSNAADCMANGAKGIAAIRLFQPVTLSDLRETVATLRRLKPGDAENATPRHPYQESKEG